jgi:putative transposase
LSVHREHSVEMSQSLAKVLIHTVFSTKNREPYLVNSDLRNELHRYLSGILSNLGCQPIAIGGVADHVHLLSTLSRTIEIAEVIKEVKRGSSLWLKTRDSVLAEFAWQSGYGVFSIGFSQIPSVKNYIANQEKHHRHMTFQDEFRELLIKYDIEFDERYAWD